MSRSLAYVWGGVSLGLIVLSPWGATMADALWPCMFKSLTGFPCPTCGTARAALALARLDLVEALTRYPLAAIGWISFLGGGVAAAAMTLAGRTPPALPHQIPVSTRLAFVTAFIVNWMYSIATGV
ncbi:MAG TPA: DUF2752 domain-containing protein [Vicinamibacteria bacterium]|nr:DUF2752 domain-containing protein [Vicinamibacteria bacterium]